MFLATCPLHFHIHSSLKIVKNWRWVFDKKVTWELWLRKINLTTLCVIPRNSSSYSLLWLITPSHPGYKSEMSSNISLSLSHYSFTILTLKCFSSQQPSLIPPHFKHQSFFPEKNVPSDFQTPICITHWHYKTI